MKKFDKIYPKKSKILAILISTALILMLISILVFGSRFNYFKRSWDEYKSDFMIDMIIIAVGTALTIVAGYILTIKNYYVITKEALVHHRMYDELYYNYGEILYIDERYTKKHGTLLFYTNKGDERYLVLDKDNKIYEALKNNCTHLVSREEFQRRFPNVKM